VTLRELLLVGAVALGVATGLAALRRAIALWPRGVRRRELERGFPAVAIVVVVTALLLLTRQLESHPLSLLVLAVLLVASAPFAVDLVAGVLVRVGRICEPGDTIRVGEVSGRVVRLGLRTCVVETAEGAQALLPYWRLVFQTVVRTADDERGTLHVFVLEVPEGPPVPEVKAAIREAVLCCPWAVPAREPEIVVEARDRYEVAVYGLDPDRRREIEDAVRRRFAA
jgi:small-conductance mechanosensitive channel